MNLNEDDLAILELLTWKVRVATATQLASHHGVTAARLDRLAAAGLLRLSTMVLSILSLDGPMCRWFPGEPAPSFHALSYQLLRRRDRAERGSERVYWSTSQAVKITGGSGGRLRQPLQVEHDLGVAQVCISRRLEESESALRWLGEDCLRKLYHPRGKIPDAVLCDTQGTVQLAIEFGGLYSAERLRRLHHHCARRKLAYELW